MNQVEYSMRHCARIAPGAEMVRSFFRTQLLNPVRVISFIRYLPHFVQVFYRLMTDRRVPLLAKSVPFIGLLLLLTPPALELDLVPFIGELDWLVVGYISLKLFLWLCPPELVREHVLQVGRGA
jgi:hypothetical protein